jgi:hypothetical protein
MEIITSFPNRSADATLNQPAIAPPRSSWVLLLLWAVIFSWGYHMVASRVLGHPDNTLLKASDHEFIVLKATGEQAKEMNASHLPSFSKGYYHWFPHLTVEGVQPLYPWLQAQSAAADGKLETMPAIYSRGQWVNVWLGLGFLLLLGGWLWSKGSLLVAANAMVLLGFGVFLPQAVFYEPNVLSYGWHGLAFALALMLLTRNGAWPHVAFGLVVGAAYLTDVSVLPLVLCWAIVTTGRFCFEIFRREAHHSWNCPGHFIGLLGLTFAFLAVIAPNLQYHHERHQTWEPLRQAYFMVENEDPAAPKLPIQDFLADSARRAELPQAWLRKLHNIAFPRMLAGTSPEGAPRILPWRNVYLWGLLVAFLIAGLHARTRGPAWFQDGPVADSRAGGRVVFVLLFTFLGLTAAAVYHGKDASDHTVLPIFQGLVLALILGGEALRQWAERRGGGGRGYTVAYRVILFLLLAHLIYSVVAFMQMPG